MTDRDRPIGVFAPARVDLSPGFTDVEPFCAEQPGMVVNVALDLGVEVTVGGTAPGPPAGAFVDLLGAAVCRRLGIARPAVRLSAPTLPPGSGLGASGALAVALAYALSLRAGASVRPADLAELACAAERDTGLTGGTQDQLASVHGGAGLVVRHRGVGARTAIDADLPALATRLVLVHGGGTRNSGSIIDQVLREGSRARALRTVRAMNRVAEQLAAGLAGGDHDGLAGLVNESTALLRELHPDIVGDGVAERLRSLGAAAAKPCGAGGRGAAWAVLVDPPARSAFVAAATATGWTVLPAAPDGAGARPTAAAPAPVRPC